jgi:hypothetical protein
MTCGGVVKGQYNSPVGVAIAKAILHLCERQPDREKGYGPKRSKTTNPSKATIAYSTNTRRVSRP